MKAVAHLLLAASAAAIVAVLVACDDGGDCGWTMGSAAYSGSSQIAATLGPSPSSILTTGGGGDSGVDVDGAATADAGAMNGSVYEQAADVANINWDPNSDSTDSNGDACDETGIPIVVNVSSCQLAATITGANYTSSSDDDDSDTASFNWGTAKITSGTCAVSVANASVTVAIDSGTVFWPDSSTVQIDFAGSVTAANGAEVNGGYATFTFKGTAN